MPTNFIALLGTLAGKLWSCLVNALVARIWAQVQPFASKADNWAINRIREWRRALHDKRASWGTVEIVVIAFLLVQLAPLSADLFAAVFRLLTTLVLWPFSFVLTFECAWLKAGIGAHVISLCLTLFASGLLWLVFRWSLLVVNDIQDSRAHVSPTPKRPVRALIMGLSDWSEDRGGTAAAAAEAAKWKGNWQEFIKAETPGGNWQQSIRRIAASIESLDVVCILASTESARQFEAFKNYAETIFDRGELPIKLVTEADGRPIGAADMNGSHLLDYENYDEVYRGLRLALDQASASVKGLLRSETCIDVTAGQKVFSIAGGVLTLNGGLMFSYVRTQPKSEAGEVRYYDAELLFADRLQRMIDQVKS